MAASEPDAHSFIVRIWLEEAGTGEHRASWRGYVTHIPGDETKYLQHLGGLIAFIRHYLEEMGVDADANESGRGPAIK